MKKFDSLKKSLKLESRTINIKGFEKMDWKKAVYVTCPNKAVRGSCGFEGETDQKACPECGCELYATEDQLKRFNEVCESPPLNDIEKAQFKKIVGEVFPNCRSVIKDLDI